MIINRVEADYSVSAQITVSDISTIAEAGFKTVICNRPDAEIEADLHAQLIEAESNRLRITFVYNPVLTSGLTSENLEAQGRAVAESKGPVLAYCRSGMRSTIVWSLLNARKLPVEEIVRAAADAGYQIDNMRTRIEAMAA